MAVLPPKDMNAIYEKPIGSFVTPNGRAECLDKAKDIVSKDRNKDYGDPEDNFREIAAIQAVIARCKDPILKVALDAIAVKIARLVNSPKHLDSWVDIAGYAACGYDIASKNAITNKLRSATREEEPND